MSCKHDWQAVALCGSASRVFRCPKCRKWIVHHVGYPACIVALTPKILPTLLSWRVRWFGANTAEAGGVR